MSEKLIKKLQNGNKLTGEEAGKIIIYSEAKELELQLAGKQSNGVLPLEKMQECINSLNNDETKTFNKYVSINNFIRYAYNTCLGHKEIAKNRLVAIETSIADIAGYTNRVRLFNRLPAIFTEKQIEDILQDAEKEFSSWKYGLTDVVCAFIGHQLNLYKENKADIRFNIIMGNYKKQILSENLQGIANLIWYDYESFTIQEAPYPLKTKGDLINALRYRNIKPLKKYTNKELSAPLTNDYIKEVTPADALELITVKTCIGEANNIHTLYDFLNNITFKDVEKLKENDINLTGSLETEFKDLYEYSLTEIKNIKGLERFNTDKEAVITLPELAKANVLEYDLFYNEQAAKKYGYDNRGVAVLHSLWNVNPCDIDNNGHYRCSMDATSYDDLAGLIHQICENHIDNSNIYKEQLQWPIAFNIILDIMIKSYGIKELEAYKISLTDIEYTINSINKRIKDLLLYKFMPMYMGRVTYPEQKLSTIREEFLHVFPYIDREFFKPAKKDIDAATTFIKDIKNFGTISPTLAPFYILYGVRR